MLRKLRKLFAGSDPATATSVSRQYADARYRGRFESLEDRRMLTTFDFIQSFVNQPGQANQNDDYGTSLAFDENLVVVGAPLEDALPGSFTGPGNGDPQNPEGLDQGVAYVYGPNSDTPLYTLINPNTDGATGLEQGIFPEDDGDRFGSDVAIVGDKIAISAPRDRLIVSQSNGVPNSLLSAGSVWTQSLGSNQWLRIDPTDPIADGNFGQAIAMSEDILIVAARASGTQGGDGIIYAINPDTGAVVNQFANVGLSADRFGEDIALDGDWVVIGASGKANGEGVVHLWNWAETNHLAVTTIVNPEPDSGDLFGDSVDIRGNKLAIAAPGYDSNTNSGDENIGIVYLYNFDQTTGLVDTASEVRILNPFQNTTVGVSDGFAASVALGASEVYVGAPLGIGSSLSSTLTDAPLAGGAVYRFDTSGSLIAPLVASQDIFISSGADYGSQIAISPQTGTVAVTATGDWSNDFSNDGGLFVFAESDPVPVKVNTTLDLPELNPGDGVVDTGQLVASGPFAGQPAVSLRAAIQEANASWQSYEICLPAGHYILDRSGPESSNAAFSDLDILGDITITGVGAGLSVIDAQFSTAGTQTRVFEVFGGGSLAVEGLTIRGGESTSQGAGVRVNEGGTFTANEIAITGNTSTTSVGGGLSAIANSASESTLVSITNSVVTNNSATGPSGGGGIFLSGNLTQLTLGGTILADNTAPSAAASRADYHMGGLTVVDNGHNLIGVIGSPAFFNSSTNVMGGTPDLIVTSVADQIDTTDNYYAFSVREAVQSVGGGTGEIWVPAWKHQLTLAGTENGAATNDLDITGDTTIVGTGPGLTVIEADFGAVDSHTRVFEVAGGGRLELSGLTVTGGETSSYGGGVRVEPGGSFDADRVAIVDNTSTASVGGGLASLANNASATTTISLTDSVVTGNSSTSGGGVLLSGNLTQFSMGGTVLAGNTSSHSLASRTDYHTGSGLTVNDLGNNLIGVVGAPALFSPSINVLGGSPTLIVTSVADEADGAFDPSDLSIREAVIEANNSSTHDEVWLPAWDFVLTRDRLELDEDTDVTVGDIDIAGSLTVRGISGATSVAWRQGITDQAFKLLGDFNEDDVVDNADFTIWRDNFGIEDADGDYGIFDANDYTLWVDSFGDALALDDVDVGA